MLIYLFSWVLVSYVWAWLNCTMQVIFAKISDLFVYSNFFRVRWCSGGWWNALFNFFSLIFILHFCFSLLSVLLPHLYMTTRNIHDSRVKNICTDIKFNAWRVFGMSCEIFVWICYYVYNVSTMKTDCVEFVLFYFLFVFFFGRISTGAIVGCFFMFVCCYFAVFQV